MNKMRGDMIQGNENKVKTSPCRVCCTCKIKQKFSKKKPKKKNQKKKPLKADPQTERTVPCLN